MNNSFPRFGVRVNSGGVYKGADARVSCKTTEYQPRKDRSAIVLIIGLLLAAGMIFLLTHLELLSFLKIG